MIDVATWCMKNPSVGEKADPVYNSPALKKIEGTINGQGNSEPRADSL